MHSQPAVRRATNIALATIFWNLPSVEIQSAAEKSAREAAGLTLASGAREAGSAKLGTMLLDMAKWLAEVSATDKEPDHNCRVLAIQALITLKSRFEGE